MQIKNKEFNERYNEYKHMIMIAANNAARRIATRTAPIRQNQQQDMSDCMSNIF